MLTWEQWREKSRSSLEAAQILLDRDKPVEAASRSYYAAYQMITTALLKLNLSARNSYGNWSHHETVEMYHTHICRKADLGFKEREALKSLRLKLRGLLETRYVADDGDPAAVVVSVAQGHWRDANRLVSLLNSLVNRGLL
ncbi:MAG: hypothetical protein ONB46_00410 [candidate division KSB1 bacterium]|nr:hypothetical protein [candidate division KSB1 bacterium]MDZ7364694.1 hypothetical protein [candidate division KSB1 bacterium]MDZ7402558.1 hypothetical protein [candidate division KSB1 bacterium]